MTPILGIRSAALILGAALLAYVPARVAAAPVADAPPARPLIVFMSDFGTVDDAVAICKGVMLGIAPGVQIIDLSHQVTPYSIAEGARLLARTAPYYQSGTVFVSVIDPGVGTARRSIVVKTKRGQYFVLPDNGLITPTVERDGLEAAREITNPRWLLERSSSSTFHGRDVYSPVAAHLARGDDWTGVGPSIDALTRIEMPQAVIAATGISGTVVALDGPYGNLVTNISAEAFRQLGYRPGDSVRVKLDRVELTVPLVSTFADVPTGEPLLFVDSRGLLSLAINQGNFARAHGVVVPTPLLIYRK
jgi:S-adenosyl-L-methionine hydrolase (adenosine-forming)